LLQEEMEPDAVISDPAQLVTNCKLLARDERDPPGEGSPQPNLQPNGFTYEPVEPVPVDVDVALDAVEPPEADPPLEPVALEPEAAEPEREAETVPEVLPLAFVEPGDVLAPGEPLEPLATPEFVGVPSGEVAPVPPPPHAARPHVTVTRPTAKRICMPGPPSSLQWRPDQPPGQKTPALRASEIGRQKCVFSTWK
jgi:hypothetical protein